MNACVIATCLSLTVVLVFDREAEDVSGLEAGAVVHAAVEERMGVGVFDVQDLTRRRHVTRDALICWDAELLLCSYRHAQLLMSIRRLSVMVI